MPVSQSNRFCKVVFITSQNTIGIHCSTTGPTELRSGLSELLPKRLKRSATPKPVPRSPCKIKI